MSRYRALSWAIALALASPRGSHAESACALPPAFGVQAGQRGAFELGGQGVVVTANGGGAPGLRAGDRVRQANGARIESCGDLELVAAGALARGLLLLLGVERDGVLLGVAATPHALEEEHAALPPAQGAEPSHTGVPAAAPQRASEPGAPASDGHTALADEASARPAARAEAPLPPRGEGSPALREAGARAAAALASVNGAAQLSVPVVLYERRLADAESQIAALAFGDAPADASVRAVVDDILRYHRTALAVRRAKLELLNQHRIDRRSPAADAVPYFSDSQVPEWVATYPFLHASLLEAPRESRMLLPGEVAGRWDPDRALELLWDRARARTERLAAWARGG